MERIENLLRFSLTPGVGPVTVHRLLAVFGDADRILGATEEEIRAVPQLRASAVKAVLEARDTDPRPELERVADAGIDMVAYDDPLFPAPLRAADAPPYLLYVRGTLHPADALAVGIVGTRQCSRYGRDQAERFGADLGRAGYTVVSGLARGIDSHAHRGALVAGARTIAVVGNGLGHMYPPENRELAIEIAQAGAVVSEFSMETLPSRETFPRRNRIIAGWSLGVLVVEAPMRSGALITARQSAEMGRDVFAIPGRIDQDVADGCHKLIREGAVLVRNLQDILDEIARPQAQPFASSAPPRNRESSAPPSAKTGKGKPDAPTPPKTPTPAPPPRQPESQSAIEARILDLIRNESMHIDRIATESGYPIAETSATLMILEIKGQIRQEPGKFFIALRR